MVANFDVGVTVSVADGASVLCLWSVEPLLSADPPFYGGKSSFSLPDLRCFSGLLSIGPGSPTTLSCCPLSSCHASPRRSIAAVAT